MELASTAVLLLSLLAADEPAVSLKEDVQVGSQVKTRFHLVLRGTVRVGEKEETVAGQALLVYPERTLEIDEAGLAKTVARFYEDARAKFVFGRSEDPRQLRPSMRLAVGNVGERGIEFWCPSGPYNSDELEIIEDTLDTTQLPGLLPKDAVKVGDTWTPSEQVQRRLCDLDQFITSSMECTLKSAEETSATILVQGKIHGLSFGAEMKANVDAKLTFDRAAGMITKVVWKQIDSRAPSPVSPPGAWEATIQIDRTREASPRLSDAVLATIDTNPSELARLMVFEDPQERYLFHYDRSWHVTLVAHDRVILRRLLGNEMVAQLNVSVVSDNAAVEEITAQKLQAMMLESGDMKVEQIIRSESIAAPGDYQLRFVNATGKRGDVTLTQRHYLARNAAGRQILFSFITEPAHEEKLGDADVAVVHSLEFLQATAGANPNPKR